MKKFFAIAALLLAGTTMASAQYVTKAFNDVTGKYDKFDWANAHNFVPIAVSTGVAEAMESVTEQGIKHTRLVLGWHLRPHQGWWRRW